MVQPLTRLSETVEPERREAALDPEPDEQDGAALEDVGAE